MFSDGMFATATVRIDTGALWTRQCMNAAWDWFKSHLDIDLDAYSFAKDDRLANNIRRLRNLMDSNWRKKHLTEDQRDKVSKAFSGGKNPRSQPWAGWRLIGFGIWNHMHGKSMHLQSLLPMMKTFAGLIGVKPEQCVFVTLPHTIFRPPGKGKRLEPHIDIHCSIADVYDKLSNTPTTKDWIRKFGVQCLAHVNGARRKHVIQHENVLLSKGGHTYGLSSFGPNEFWVMLSLIHPDCCHGNLPDVLKKKDLGDEWVQKRRSPTYLPWFDTKWLALVEEICQATSAVTPGECNVVEAVISNLQDTDTKKWLRRFVACGLSVDPLRRMCTGSKKPYKIRPVPICPDKPGHGPYLSMWLSCFPHFASYTGVVPRLTFTVPIQPATSLSEGKHLRTRHLDGFWGAPHTRDFDRGFERLKCLVRGDLDSVRADTCQYHGGSVHKHTATEADIYPFFKALYPSEEVVVEKYKTLKEWNNNAKRLCRKRPRVSA